MDGFAVSHLLREKWGIQVEWESPQAILAMMSIFHEQADWERLFQALQQVAGLIGYRPTPVKPLPAMPLPEVKMNPRQAFFAPKTVLPFKECINRLAGEMVVPYPPGIPCLLPGELITSEVYDYLLAVIRGGVRLQGASSPKLDQMTIIA